MKKIIFTILLTIVSSVWTTSKALCYVFPNVVTTEVNTMEGTLQLDSNPCTNSEPCPPCQTLSFVADNGHSYYISFDNKYSDMLEPELDALTPYLPLRVSITGAFMSNLVDVYVINNVPFRGTGQWQVYKQGVTKTAYHVAGEPTETYNVDNGDVHWLFEDNIVYDALCSTCYNVPASYSATLSKNGTYLLSIDGKYDMQNHSNPTEIGNSPIVIYKLTEDSMEWKFTVYGGDEEPVTYYQYLRHYPAQEQPRLPSLCDEWNVWYESFQSFGPINYNAVIKYRLATDTMINGQRYVQLASDNSPYMEGALREGSNRDIYYIPSRSTHEYLLYAFNAQVGDTITNLYVGAMGKEEGYQAVVRAISDSNPRIFTVGVNIDEYTEYSIKWIEGVGSPETPYGLAVVPTVPADPGVYSLLCAYKNGEQVYVSEWGEQYGCVYREDFIEGEFVTLNGNIVASFRECSIDGCPRCFGTFMTQDASFYLLTATDTLIMEQLNMLYLGKQYTIKGVWTKCKNTPFIEVNAIYETKDTIPSDTIPLYIKDGPGTSTVEPVDPNEIVAKILDGDLLMVEYLHETIYYNLSKAPASNPSSVAAMPLNQVVAADSFIDSETVPLIESGTYSLEMSNPGWNYTIVGTFVYKAPQGIEQTSTTAPSATKTLREGQLLIRQGNRLYTPTGIRIQ